MDIPKKDYDALSDRQRYGKNRIFPFIILTGILAAAIFIALTNIRTEANRTQNKQTTKATPERKPGKVVTPKSNIPVQRQKKDDVKIKLLDISNSIRKAIERNDVEYLSKVGAYYYYHGETEEIKTLGIEIIKTVEKMQENKVVKTNPMQENQPTEHTVSNKDLKTNDWLSNRDEIIAEYNKRRTAMNAEKVEQNRVVVHSPKEEEKNQESYEERLRKERQERIDTEKRTRREATTGRLRMGQDKAGISTPVEVIRRPRKRIK